MTKVDIISGFLGAGKTTLIKKLIEDGLNTEKVVLIENEYGEVGIDGGFLKDSGIQITEMNSGCICCTLVGDFVTSIKEIMEKFSPDRIIIEPSGVGKLSDVMAAVIGLEEEIDIKLDALVTVVNVLSFKKQKQAFGEFFSNQIEHATTVIMSRTQNADDEKVESCMKMIQELNSKAAIISTPWSEIPGEKILSVMEGRENLAMKALAMEHHEHDSKEHEEHHHHGDVHPLEDHAAHGDAQGMQSTPASGAPLHAIHHHDHDHHEGCDCPHCKEHHHHNHEHEHGDEHHHHDHEHHHHDHEHCEHDHHGDEHHHHDHHDHDHHDHNHHHHHADEIFDTWGIETAHKFDSSTIERAMEAFANEDGFGDVLRAKGMVCGTDNEWIYFDFVEGDYELRHGEPDYTGRLVVIGTDLKEEKIKALFGL